MHQTSLPHNILGGFSLFSIPDCQYFVPLYLCHQILHNGSTSGMNKFDDQGNAQLLLCLQEQAALRFRLLGVVGKQWRHAVLPHIFHLGVYNEIKHMMIVIKSSICKHRRHNHTHHQRHEQRHRHKKRNRQRHNETQTNRVSDTSRHKHIHHIPDFKVSLRSSTTDDVNMPIFPYTLIRLIARSK